MTVQSPSENVNSETAAPKSAAGEIVHIVKDTTVLALDGAKDISAAALGGMVHVVGHTTSHALKAAEGVGEELTVVTKNMFVGVIKGFSDVTAAIGNAILENARGTVKGVGLVGSDVGAVAKNAALGVVHGTSEVTTELGKVYKNNALGAIKGVSEISTDLGALTKDLALGAVKGTAEVAMSVEAAVMQTARAVILDVGEIRGEYRKTAPLEKVEKASEPARSAATSVLSESRAEAPVAVPPAGKQAKA